MEWHAAEYRKDLRTPEQKEADEVFEGYMRGVDEGRFTREEAMKYICRILGKEVSMDIPEAPEAA